MSHIPVTTEAYLDAAAGLLGLTIEPDWRPGVAKFLELAAEMAATLETVELDDGELVLAAVYTPPEAGRAERD